MARVAGSSGEVTARVIREESLKLIARHGYAAVSMRMIADAVGVRPSALYQYHKTKQDLLVALMQGHMEALLAAWGQEARAGAGEGAVAALERFARFHIRFHITRPDDVFISYMELRALEPEGFALIEKMRRDYEAVPKSILAEGIASGAFAEADPHVAAMAILAMLTGVNTWYRSGGRLSQSKIEDMYAEMVLRSVGAAVENQGVARRAS